MEKHALTPEAVENAIRLTEQDDSREARERLQSEREDVARRLKRLLDAIEAGGDVPLLVARVREMEAKRDALAK